MIIVDSHTGGEPTRLVIDGGPELGAGPIAERLAVFRERFDHVRAGVVNEPRGSDVMVGALLLAPHDPSSTAGVIFFNNVGFLGMCGHGTIGLIVSLAWLGKIHPGTHRIETPVGIVDAILHEDSSVTVQNVPAYRFRQHVAVEVAGYGLMHGDIAWGGNWFFLVADHGQTINAQNVELLTAAAWAVRHALEENNITGADGALIDHIEFFADAETPGIDSRNFVLCPGKAYDRSPCGTGTCAKIACLAADGILAPGSVWRQESVIGSVFDAHYDVSDDLPPQHISPRVRGTAHVTAKSELVFSNDDPFVWGIPQ